MFIYLIRLLFIGSIVNFYALHSIDATVAIQKKPTISAKKILADGSEIELCNNTPCSDMEKLIQDFVTNQNSLDESLSATMTPHPQHVSLTIVYGVTSFYKKAKEFSEILSCSPLEYGINEGLLENSHIFYVDEKNGILPTELTMVETTGLGIFRYPHKMQQRYFLATGIKDCIFLSVFNKKTKKSFCVHTNYLLFADDTTRDFATFPRMLEGSLKKIRGETAPDNSDLQISFVTSYLSTGLKALYDQINNLGYLRGADVRVDCYCGEASSDPETLEIDSFIPQRKKPYLIRTVGEATNRAIVSYENASAAQFAEVSYSRPVTVHQNLLSQYQRLAGKNVIFDKSTGTFNNITPVMEPVG